MPVKARISSGSCLRLAATRRFREDSECVSSLGSALLLKLGNPIGYGINHFTRSFAGGIYLRLGSRSGLFTLLHDSDCFFL